MYPHLYKSRVQVASRSRIIHDHRWRSRATWRLRETGHIKHRDFWISTDTRKTVPGTGPSVGVSSCHLSQLRDYSCRGYKERQRHLYRQ